ncbi:Conserved_hypothetical protein [Hexamita inflata]|uniref:Uncharacterized protein n=1 Tax=Hexamita inflata TaxID=28002 RepID=A0AA86QZ09_9EUKA|nr:Conserved hypothetical protein [Hexamita inflata]
MDINDPLVQIAMKRCGITKNMLQQVPDTYVSTNNAKRNQEIFQQLTQQRSQTVLQEELEKIKQHGITEQEFIAAGRPKIDCIIKTKYTQIRTPQKSTGIDKRTQLVEEMHLNILRYKQDDIERRKQRNDKNIEEQRLKLLKQQEQLKEYTESVKQRALQTKQEQIQIINRKEEVLIQTHQKQALNSKIERDLRQEIAKNKVTEVQEQIKTHNEIKTKIQEEREQQLLNIGQQLTLKHQKLTQEELKLKNDVTMALLRRKKEDQQALENLKNQINQQALLKSNKVIEKLNKTEEFLNYSASQHMTHSMRLFENKTKKQDEIKEKANQNLLEIEQQRENEYVQREVRRILLREKAREQEQANQELIRAKNESQKVNSEIIRERHKNRMAYKQSLQE